MCFDISRHNIQSFRAPLARSQQHAERFPHTGGGAEENLQAAAAALGFGTLYLFQQCVGVGTLLIHENSLAQCIEGQVEFQHIHPRLAQNANWRPAVCSATNLRNVSGSRLRTRATRASWYSAAAGLMCGSSPLADAVTRSTGTGW